MNNKLRRQRSKNFTEHEEGVLVKLVKANQLVIENKKSGAVIWKQKEETWEKIALDYTRKTGMKRTAHALKAKYEGLKKKLKSELAGDKTNSFRTVDEPKANTNVSNASEQVNEIDESATELRNIVDSDEISSDVDRFQLANSVFESSKVDLPEPHSEINEGTPGSHIHSEKQGVLLAHQAFYEQENVRAQEKHQAEMELLRLKREKEVKAIQLLDLQIAEKRRCIKAT
ncbi:uncharacterized protein LOC117786242 [Drosophila innubila]|uniref:uncharacterized protein LOC117786242 n=1 Tax=Drosophila innubila TaxID=198719 RepID=UPI00148DEEC9|nr:uncharacterized protein LOC117786242 [Drosophila innubila]